MKRIKIKNKKVKIKELKKHSPDEKPDNRMIVVYLKRGYIGESVPCRWSPEEGWNGGKINEQEIDFWAYMADVLKFHNYEKSKVSVHKKRKARR